MLKIDVVRFDIPKDSPSQVAQRIDEALQQVDRSQNTVLRMVFTVTPSPALLRKKTLNEFRNAVEPFRSRVRYTCVENVVVVRNPSVAKLQLSSRTTTCAPTEVSFNIFVSSMATSTTTAF